MNIGDDSFEGAQNVLPLQCFVFPHSAINTHVASLLQPTPRAIVSWVYHVKAPPLH